MAAASKHVAARARGVRRWPLFAVALAAFGLAACHEPAVGRDSYEQGRQRVVDLVNEAGAALPAGSGFHPVTRSDTDREVCRTTFLGYAVGTAGSRQPEVTTFVNLPARLNDDAMLAVVEAKWRARGYVIDRSDAHDPRYPKIRARTDGYTAVVTSFRRAVNRITLYAVAPCLRGPGPAS